MNFAILTVLTGTVLIHFNVVQWKMSTVFLGDGNLLYSVSVQLVHYYFIKLNIVLLRQ